MNEYKMDNKSKILLIVMITILLIVVEIVIYYCLYSKNMLLIPAIEDSSVKEASLQNILGVLILVGLILAYCMYIFILLSKLYNNTIYIINDDFIIAEKGVLFRRKKIMRISSVQYMKTVSFPFAKFLGLNFIVFNGYGNKLVFTFISQNDLYDITKNVRMFSEQQHYPKDENGENEI